VTPINYKNQTMGIYIHIPFCRKKCDYCDFYSLPGCNSRFIDEYCRMVTDDISRSADILEDQLVSSIFLGGGTPSLLSGQQINMILQQAYASFRVLPDAEITLEANPAALDMNKLEEYLQAGINRISLGVQSFNDEELMILGRLHKARHVLEAASMFNKCGLKNYSFDLIYGIPGQTIRSWENNLHKAMEMAPAHISTYLLQLDPETEMGKKVARRILTLLDEEIEAAMYESAIDILAAGNYSQYEISNFSIKGYECQHNLSYWHGCNYLGIGAGAVSFINNRRYAIISDVKQYMAAMQAGGQAPTEELENMTAGERLADVLILGLRLVEGINIQAVNQCFNVDIMEEYKREIEDNIKKGLLIIKNGQLSLTRRGYFISNSVLCHFVA
jgi:oxygen-independent coproporphyrinogen-3 oxidase